MEDNENLPSEQNKKTTEIAPALFKEFLDNQTKEIELKSREIDLQKQKDDHGFEFAKTALEAQADDRKQLRAFQLKSKRSGHIFTTIIVLFFIVLLITALAMDKDQVALEIIKAVIFMTTGGAGGYAIGRIRNINPVDSPDSNKSS